MRDLVILFVHMIAMLARLLGPGGIRSVVAESVLIRQQLLILNRSRRSPQSTLFRSPGCRFVFSPNAPRPPDPFGHRTETFDSLELHRTLRSRKYRLLFSSERRHKPGPKGSTKDLIAAVVQTKHRNPTWGCPRIAQQIALAFNIPDRKSTRLNSSH